MQMQSNSDMNLHKNHVFSFQNPSNSSNNASLMNNRLGFSGKIMMEPLPGLKHDTGLAVDWSFQEQAVLNDALIKYASECGIMKYVKIAELFPEKNVRDVALRCQWMAKKESVKRRKIAENFAGKKIQGRKMADSSRIAHLVPRESTTAYSFMSHPTYSNDRFSYEAPAVDSATQHLLDENIRVLNLISANLSTYKLQDNIELFSRTSNNITFILNSMSQTPGIMSQMPLLPLAINEDLLNSIIPIPNQASIYEEQE